MNSLRYLFLAAPLTAMAFSAHAEDSIAIGSVNIAKVMTENVQSQKLRKQMEGRYAGRISELEKEQNSIKADEQKLNANKALMSRDQLQKDVDRLQKRIEAYQKKAEPLQQEIEKLEKEAGDKVIKPAQEIIDQIAAQKKLKLVLTANQPGVLYLDKSTDITQEVLDKLNAKLK